MKKITLSKKIIVGLVLCLAIVVAGGVILWNKHSDTTKQTALTEQTAAAEKAALEAKRKVSITYKGVEGKTALAILKEKHKVDVKTYSFGDQVTGIDGSKGTGPKYWTFYLNGKMSDEGAGTYQTKASDIIEWKLEQL